MVWKLIVLTYYCSISFKSRDQKLKKTKIETISIPNKNIGKKLQKNAFLGKMLGKNCFICRNPQYLLQDNLLNTEFEWDMDTLSYAKQLAVYLTEYRSRPP